MYPEVDHRASRAASPCQGELRGPPARPVDRRRGSTLPQPECAPGRGACALADAIEGGLDTDALPQLIGMAPFGRCALRPSHDTSADPGLVSSVRRNGTPANTNRAGCPARRQPLVKRLRDEGAVPGMAGSGSPSLLSFPARPDREPRAVFSRAGLSCTGADAGRMMMRHNRPGMLSAEPCAAGPRRALLPWASRPCRAGAQRHRRPSGQRSTWRGWCRASCWSRSPRSAQD
jgi:hypothetical protein